MELYVFDLGTLSHPFLHQVLPILPDADGFVCRFCSQLTSSSSAFRRWLLGRTSLRIAQDMLYPKLFGGEYQTVVSFTTHKLFDYGKIISPFPLITALVLLVLLRWLEDSVGRGYALKSVECNMKARACNYSLCSLLLRDGTWVIIITWCSQSTGGVFLLPLSREWSYQTLVTSSYNISPYILRW